MHFHNSLGRKLSSKLRSDKQAPSPAADVVFRSISFDETLDAQELQQQQQQQLPASSSPMSTPNTLARAASLLGKSLRQPGTRTASFSSSAASVCSSQPSMQSLACPESPPSMVFCDSPASTLPRQHTMHKHLHQRTASITSSVYEPSISSAGFVPEEAFPAIERDHKAGADNTCFELVQADEMAFSILQAVASEANKAPQKVHGLEQWSI